MNIEKSEKLGSKIQNSAAVPDWWNDIPESEQAVIRNILRQVRLLKQSDSPAVARAARMWDCMITCFIRWRLMHRRRQNVRLAMRAKNANASQAALRNRSGVVAGPVVPDIGCATKPEHKTHFRPVAEWYQIGPVLGNFTCGSSFKPGSFQRSNETIDGHRFLVLESDTLSRNEVGAVFAYVRRRLRYKLHCIIDTAGKSLHAWFDAPRNPTIEARLKAGLQVFGCDPKVFTYSQPVRVPGAFRDGRLQKLIWLRDEG